VVFDLEWLEGRAEAEFPAPHAATPPSAAARVFPADPSHLVHGLVALNIGGVVALPTDTLYGEQPPPPPLQPLRPPRPSLL